jgi:hypothetical protein
MRTAISLSMLVLCYGLCAYSQHPVVALIDTGAWEKHESLRGQIIESVDFTGGTGPSFHGTAMASVICGRNLVAGVSSKIKIIDLDVGDKRKIYRPSIIAALIWCTANKHRIDAVNMSWSIGKIETEKKEGDMTRYFRELRAAGVKLFSSAGNDGEIGMSYPAHDPYVTSVTCKGENESEHSVFVRGKRDIAVYSDYPIASKPHPMQIQKNATGTSVACAVSCARSVVSTENEIKPTTIKSVRWNKKGLKAEINHDVPIWIKIEDFIWHVDSKRYRSKYVRWSTRKSGQIRFRIRKTPSSFFRSE